MRTPSVSPLVPSKTKVCDSRPRFAPCNAVTGETENLTAGGTAPLQWLLIVGDGEADGDPIAERRGQAEHLFVEADDAPLRDQEPARRDRLDRVPRPRK